MPGHRAAGGSCPREGRSWNAAGPGLLRERYRLTFPVARSAAFSLVALIPAIFSHQPLPWLILCPLVFALATVPWVLTVAGGKIAFRADITRHHARRRPAELAVPARLGRVRALVRCRGHRLVPRRRAVRLADRGDPCIAIQRRPGAPALSRGNKPARRCPVPGVAAGAVRPVTAWRLDRDRLAALISAVAPGIPSLTRELARLRVLNGRAKQERSHRRGQQIRASLIDPYLKGTVTGPGRRR